MSNQIIDELEGKLQKSLGALKKDLSKVRTGVASMSLIEDIKVMYYNQPTSLNQVATIAVPDSRTITIQPWDSMVVSEIEKAIQKSDLGVNPMSDGKTIRLSFPKLTEERRKELTKLGSKMLEGTRVAMRNVRREINEKLKKMEKDKLLSKDDAFKQQEDVQKLTDRYIEMAEKTYSEKEKEILEI
ncbi:ribosome recycling factor [Syntrophorhabdus aromaticivorans]|jgi:ribosome recycling factor|uniref:ribosome recycling factor n=1 Tax=Syntrophorhabdus aromaticivorans TaxID=328301 RepID=UPI00041965C5|nr:ribosome recycling factor [Syntrophorhabdus aromaticivorans]